jgi:hypothetical protein
MTLNLASPGIKVREVDLTTGGVRPSQAITGALVAPFAQGPVETQNLITTENELLNVYGKPYSVDNHFEHWLVASSYLSYGGQLRIVRADDEGLRNAYVSVAGTTGSTVGGSGVKIKSPQHYQELAYNLNILPTTLFAARNPGSWADGIRVAIIDSKADQILTVTGIGSTTANLVGTGITQAITKTLPGSGTTSTLDGYLKGIITGINTTANTIDVKVLAHVSSAGTVTNVDYQDRGIWEFETGGIVVGINTGTDASPGAGASYTVASKLDWFENQTIAITPSLNLDWDGVAPRPQTTEFGEARGARFDEFHILVIDGTGSITGNAGSILERHIGLSKATKATFTSGAPAYWRSYLEVESSYLFGLAGPSGITTVGFGEDFELETDTGWDQDADSILFGCIGAQNYVLSGGKNYSGISTITAAGALSADVGDIGAGYDLFENDEIPVDFLLMGSAAYPQADAQALANKIISVAELRKDAIAFISPYRGAAITDTSSQTSVSVRSIQDTTNNVVSFYAPITSSSYAVFDSGYKYMFDRFNDTFRYVPLNGDIAGLCARTDINQFPWYSPAGTARGAILNAVKLPYNPGRIQRDELYTNRINPVIFSPGAGIVLFGDKTGFGRVSAFDRINVRRLFIYIEKAIRQSARDVLFEFNDSLTRQNFVNTIEPFLRDVKAKRGIFDFLIVCDERNNTPAVIDNNEFIADIYVKPTRSINFIGLTFIATKTGVAFEEVVGQF